MKRNCLCGGRYVPCRELSDELTAGFECNICGDKRLQGKRQPSTRADKHKAFSHNSDDQIYHQKTPNNMRCAFLVVSEFFDTPSPGVTEVLQFVVDKLNERETS